MKQGRSPPTVSANERKGITYYIFSRIKQGRSRRTKKEEVHSTRGVWLEVLPAPSPQVCTPAMCDGEHSALLCAWQLPSIACLQPHVFLQKAGCFSTILPGTRWEKVKTSVGTILSPLGVKRCDNLQVTASWPVPSAILAFFFWCSHHLLWVKP